MNYLLVIQLPYRDELDFEKMISLEDTFDKVLGDIGEVDGHDEGSGEINVFIRTTRPQDSFNALLGSIEQSFSKNELKAAFRPESGSMYSIIWPEDLTEFTVK